MSIPTWITLKQVPEEFQAVAFQIAEGIGELIGIDTSNDHSQDPRFCVALDSSKRWEPAVFVTNEITKITKKIIIDYNFLPIRCRYCLDTNHCVRDCPERPNSRRYRDQGNNRTQGSIGPETEQENGHPAAIQGTAPRYFNNGHGRNPSRAPRSRYARQSAKQQQTGPK